MSALLALSVCGCSKFLDVNPKGETFDNDMFTSAEGYEDALYGIYSELSAKEDLYGGNLVWMAEVMSQNTTALSDNTFGNLATANWKINGPTSLRKKGLEKCLHGDKPPQQHHPARRERRRERVQALQAVSG